MARKKRKRKIAKTQPNQKRKKLNFINNKLRQFSQFFGTEGSEYKNLEKLVITQSGVTPNTQAFREIFPSRSPLQLTDNFELFASDEYIDELYKKFKTVILYKKISERYGVQFLSEYNSGKSNANKAQQIDYNFFRKHMKELQSYVSQRSIFDTLSDLISDLPNYYAALDNMDATTQTILRKRFSDYGSSYDEDTGKRDEDLARQLMDDIYKYYEDRLSTGSMIKNSERIVNEDSILEQMIKHNSVKFKMVEDDNSPNWGNARKKMKK